jgi:microprocessor complex subunit DGCR8
LVRISNEHLSFRATLEILIPEIKEKLSNPQGVAGEVEGLASGCPDLGFFDGVRVEDPRVAELCARTSEPPPYQILLTCLQRYETCVEAPPIS